MIIIFIVFLIILLVYYGIQIVILFKARSKNEVSEAYKVYLNGYEQAVLIEGKSKENPLLIVLHGGPGVAFPLGMGSRGLFPELTEEFITVYWDQYGCGRNYKKLDSDIDIKEYTKMLEDLISQLKVKFPDREVYLFGMSWGTILGLKTAIDLKHKISGVVAYGQFISQDKNHDIVVDTLNDVTMKEQDQSVFKAFKDDKDFESKEMLDDLVSKYTSGMQHKEGNYKNYISLILKNIISPDYSLFHFVKSQTGFNNIKSNTNIISELKTLNLESLLEEVTIPYHIIQGKEDLITSTKLVKETLENADNDNITYKELDKSGHLPSAEDFNQLLKLVSDIKEK